MKFQLKIKSERVKPENRISTLFYYEFRRGGFWSKPVTIEKSVSVDFGGTLISTVNLDGLFAETDYYLLKPTNIYVLDYHTDGEFFDGVLLFPTLTAN